MITIDIRVKKIMDLFHIHNQQIYVVGGAVRDLFLNYLPFDYDLTTSATPNLIKSILKDYSLDLKGQQWGSFSLILDNLNLQITTMRKEEFKNIHYPSKVIFTTLLDEDLQRRDFTINAICFNKNGLYDKFNGLDDLKNRTLTLIGDKSLRFKQDPLRILRAIRFAINLDLNIEEETLFYIKKDFSLVNKLNKNLINKEIKKINQEKAFNNPLNQLILPLLNYKL